MSAQRSSNLLQNIYLFKELNPEELEKVSSISRIESFNPGDEVFAQGDQAHSVYVVQFGSVKIQHNGKNDLVDVATLGTGSHFGEMAFVDGEARSATVSAIERAEIIRIDFDDLRQVIESHPSIAVKIYKSLARYLCGRLRLTTNDLTFARERNLRHA